MAEVGKPGWSRVNYGRAGTSKKVGIEKVGDFFEGWLMPDRIRWDVSEAG